MPQRRWPGTPTAPSAINSEGRAATPPALRRGVVGLGAGTLAADGRAGDVVRMYEIDPDVERVARAHFTYLRDAPAAVSVVLGDGRLSLEREADQMFDVLVLDAFSGDSIPVHLLTREAFDTYRRHVRPGGVIAVNVTNHSLHLAPVVGNLAAHLGLSAIVVDHRADEKAGCPRGEESSSWALVSADPAFFDAPPLAGAGTTPAPAPAVGLWTDDQVDLLAVVRRPDR